MIWLDFVNTEMVVRGEPVDAIPDFDHLRSWLVRAGLVSAAEVRRSPRLVQEAHALRAALRQQAESIAAGDRALSATAEINRVLKAAPSYPQLAKGELRQVTTFTDPVGVLSGVAHSAAEFLASGDYSLLKHCEGKGCVLFFYDTTKNHARRFCSAEGCGNRYKAAARYERIKRAASARSG